MKTTKAFIGVFFATFLIGLIVYYLIPQTKSVVITAPVLTAPSEIISQDYKTDEVGNFETPEVLEENTDWENSDELKFRVRLLETGEGFHGDQVDAESGEIWLGLFEKGNKFFLKQTKLRIKRVNDPIVDGDNGKTGKSVMVFNQNPSIFLLKNADFLKQGEVQSFLSENSNGELAENQTDLSLGDGFRREFDYRGETVTLAVKSGINKKGEKIAALILSNGKVNQTLHSLEYIKDGNYLGTLNWVGDLDGDGKADFYLELYCHDNVAYRNLFLSSKANKGKLVRKIAVFTTTGC